MTEPSARVQVYSTDYCAYCMRAKALLERRKIPYVEIDVSRNPSMRNWLVGVTGRRTVPQIFIDGQPIGGYVELVALERRGDLDALGPTSTDITDL